MTTEHFTKTEFDIFAQKEDISYLSLIQGEHAYVKEINEWSRIMIRSSLNYNGVAKDSGEDSIRIWLQLFKADWMTGEFKWLPALSKAQAKERGIPRWITRLPGWQERIVERIELFEKMAIRREVPICERCGEPASIFLAKTEKNMNRPFATHCGQFMTWMDEPIEDIKEYKEEIIEQVKIETNPFDGIFVEKEEAITTPIVPLPVETPEPIKDKVFEIDSNSTEEQILGITAKRINLRMIATAGSGKTTNIVKRIKFHLTVGGLGPRDIVAVSFNKTAAMEMKDQVMAVMPEMKDSPLPGRICTIHAFNLRTLRIVGINRKVKTTFDRDFWQLRSELERIAKNIWFKRGARRPAPGELLRAFNEAKYYGIPLGEDGAYQTKRHGEEFGEGLMEARTLFDRWMVGRNEWMFSDMLFEMEQRLIFDEKFRNHVQGIFKVVIVDESQDVVEQAMRILVTVSQYPGWNEIYKNYNGGFFS